MSTTLITIASVGWLLGLCIVYGKLVKRNVQGCTEDAAVFGCLSGFVVFAGVAALLEWLR
ncbi:MAG: hypothetical protein K8F33_00055 [Thermomonas sp.]|uniref:hypothetical protein n=1 Tax=Thermomonas sp. TaxID=1971895 RepID=UPI001D90D377|nr:hypothetical protein [Thermomonas sp.]MBZ0086486.1 hypothetical protein [Thermomonas sp.]